MQHHLSSKIVCFFVLRCHQFAELYVHYLQYNENDSAMISSNDDELATLGHQAIGELVGDIKLIIDSSTNEINVFFDENNMTVFDFIDLIQDVETEHEISNFSKLLQALLKPEPLKPSEIAKFPKLEDIPQFQLHSGDDTISKNGDLMLKFFEKIAQCKNGLTKSLTSKKHQQVKNAL